jgi:hypothetical protein
MAGRAALRRGQEYGAGAAAPYLAERVGRAGLPRFAWRKQAGLPALLADGAGAVGPARLARAFRLAAGAFAPEMAA